MKTYECSICWNVNHVSKLHCSTCGTIPAMYSIWKEPIKNDATETALQLSPYISVVVAFGCERQASHRTIKRLIRTVPFDYYASL